MAQVKIVDREVVITKVVQLAQLELTKEETRIIRDALWWQGSPNAKGNDRLLALLDAITKLYNEME